TQSASASASTRAPHRPCAKAATKDLSLRALSPRSSFFWVRGLQRRRDPKPIRANDPVRAMQKASREVREGVNVPSTRSWRELHFQCSVLLPRSLDVVARETAVNG